MESALRFIPQPAGASRVLEITNKESPNYNNMLKLSGQPSVSQKRRFLQGRGQQQRATATVVTKHIIFMSKKRRELIEIYKSEVDVKIK